MFYQEDCGGQRKIQEKTLSFHVLITVEKMDHFLVAGKVPTHQQAYFH